MSEEKVSKELEEKLNASGFEGFQVVDEVEVEDLTNVKDERPLLPTTTNVKLEIKALKPGASEDNKYRWITPRFALVDGLGADGKYKNMNVFGENICYFADSVKYIEESTKPKSKEFFVKKGHLIALKFLLLACNKPVVGTKINDELLNELVGTQLIATIKQYQNSFTAKDGTEVNRLENQVVSHSMKKIDVASTV